MNRWVIRAQRAIKAWLTRRAQRRHAFTVFYTLLNKQDLANPDCMRIVFRHL